MNRYGISHTELGYILGVSADTVSRWLSNKQAPSELNMYKLHCFVYLVLNVNASYFSVVSMLKLNELTLDKSPIGDCYYAPWDHVDPAVSDYIASKLLQDGYGITKIKDTSSLADRDIECDQLYTDEEFLKVMIEEHDDCYLEDCYEIEKCLGDAFDLNGCSYQESIRRVEFLKKICDTYIGITKIFMDTNIDDVIESYVKVHSFDSFADFVNEFNSAALIDERFEKEHVYITLSHYTDLSLKTVSTKRVRSITMYRDHFKIRCDDDSVCRIDNDERFMINHTGTLRSDVFRFLIRIGSDYYALSLELG